jgi:two-component sensor histidine kinase
MVHLESFPQRVSHSWLKAQCSPPWAAAAAVSVSAGAVTFDAMTPQIISVGMFYAGLVLIGFWFTNPKSAFTLALFATALIVAGNWITLPDNTPAWEAWLNRTLAIGTVWMTAVFVWYIRVLEQKLKVHVDVANELSREIEHRVGNQLQLIASFLRLQATGTCNEDARRALELAGSRIMVIGKIQRLLSSAAPSHKINTGEFIGALITQVRSTLPDRNQVDITVRADAAEFASTQAIPLGALLVELINNAVKHAFPDGMKGTVAVSFTASKDNYVLECTDDGIGIDRRQATRGFGTENVSDLARLMHASITCQPAHRSTTRPGTMWRLVLPHQVAAL